MLIFAAEIVDFFFFLQERLYNIAILVINRNVMSVTNSIYCCVIFGTRMLHELITICLHNNYNSRMYLHKVEGLLTKKKRKKKKKKKEKKEIEKNECTERRRVLHTHTHTYIHTYLHAHTQAYAKYINMHACVYGYAHASLVCMRA